jgi:hypothetical protein
LTVVGVLIVCLLAATRHYRQMGQIRENERHWPRFADSSATLCGPCGAENFPGCVLTTSYRAPDQSVANTVRAYLLDQGLGWSEVDVLTKDGQWNVAAITGSTVVTPALCDSWIKEMRYVCEDLGCSLEYFGAPPDGGGGLGVPRMPD